MTRPVKTLLCFLTAAVLLVGAWLIEGAPVRTAAAICRRAERELLTEDIQPVRAFRKEGETLMLARAGEQMLSFRYNAPQGVEAPQFAEKGVIAYWNGRFYALGPEAASATITATAYQMTLDPRTREHTIHQQKTFSYEGVSAGEGVWTFTVPMDGPDSLPRQCWNWYTLEQDPHLSSRTLMNGPVDLTLTLYRDDGSVLTEIDATMESSQLRILLPVR